MAELLSLVSCVDLFCTYRVKKTGVGGETECLLAGGKSRGSSRPLCGLQEGRNQRSKSDVRRALRASTPAHCSNGNHTTLPQRSTGVDSAPAKMDALLNPRSRERLDDRSRISEPIDAICGTTLLPGPALIMPPTVVNGSTSKTEVSDIFRDATLSCWRTLYVRD